MVLPDPCDLRCTREFKLLCGSNSKTYNNECLKKEDECRTGSQIGVVGRGPCSDSSVVFPGESPEPEGKSFIKRAFLSIPDSADSLKKKLRPDVEIIHFCRRFVCHKMLTRIQAGVRQRQQDLQQPMPARGG